MEKVKNSNTGTLVIVRHGQSRFNELNIFTGWLDVPLSEKGIMEAHKVADHCKKFDYDAVFTSHLKRAHETLTIILSKQEKMGVFQHQGDEKYNIPDNIDPKLNSKLLRIYSDNSLNERAYGNLQGLDKQKATQIYGESRVAIWRRGFTERPPGGESLRDVYERAIPYLKKTIVPRLKKGETILVVGHGNTLRAVIKFLENISDDKIPFISLPLGLPLVYEYKNGKMTRVEGEYTFDKSELSDFLRKGG